MSDREEKDRPSPRGTAGRRAPSEKSADLPAARRPLERSVRWVPKKLRLAGRDVTPACDVFVSRSVLAALQKHLASAEGEVGGLLAGRPFRCPESGRMWIRVEGIEPLPASFPEDAEVEEASARLETLRQSLTDRRNGAQVVGWYHSHALLGVFLSDRDARLHLQRFPLPWQCAMVLVADPRRPAGGLFQPSAPGQIARSVYYPFYELLDGEGASGGEGAGAEPMLGWENYVAEAPGLPPRAEPSPGRRGGRPVERPARPGQRRGPEEPPGTGRTPGRRGMDRVSAEGYPVEVPLVLPAEEGGGLPGLLRRHGGRVLRLLTLLVLLLGAWFVWDRVLERPETIGAVTGDEASETDGPQAASARPDGEEVGTNTGDTVSPSAAFEEALEAFSSMAEAYDERRQDFDLGRIGCDGLVPGYATVDEAFLRASEMFVRVRDVAGAPPVERYDTASRRMEGVDRHFDASGCPRPE